MIDTSELSGDSRLTPLDRMRYLSRNFLRNIKLWTFSEDGFCSEQYVPERLRISGASSPGRVLTFSHLKSHLPKLIPIGKISVLEIGCGSGSLRKVLSDLGYEGRYVGVDPLDRFSRNQHSRFYSEYYSGDVHDYVRTGGKFDLVISVSALEHIPRSAELIALLPKMLTRRGVELHYVPSGWALLTYLWHGYRQYPLSYIKEIFGSERTKVMRLGGGCSFLFHLLVITLLEVIFRIRVRDKHPKVYVFFLKLALRFDRFLKFCPTMFAVSRTAKQKIAD